MRVFMCSIWCSKQSADTSWCKSVISWLNMLAKHRHTTCGISKSPGQKLPLCSSSRFSHHSLNWLYDHSDSYFTTRQYCIDMTIWSKAKYSSHYDAEMMLYQSHSMPFMHWPKLFQPLSKRHTLPQVSGGHMLCVFSQQCSWECQLRLFIHILCRVRFAL